MNRSTKLYLAAVLLAAGYGVASLLGSPSTLYLPHNCPQSPAEAAVGLAGAPTTLADSEHILGGVRLLPDRPTAQRSATSSIAAQVAELTSPSVAPPLAATSSSLSSTATAAMTPSTSLAHTMAPPPFATPASAGVSQTNNFARLDDTSPRPFQPQQIVTKPLLGRPQYGPPPAIAQAEVPVADATRDETSTIAGTGPPTFARAAPAQVSTRGDATTPFAVVNSPALLQVSTLPSSAAPSLLPPKTHIVVDGDSLAKLAKRYLDSPDRADVIFAANRDVLKSPDLLPIGVELKIPGRATARGG